jgi:hypothetical protein
VAGDTVEAAPTVGAAPLAEAVTFLAVDWSAVFLTSCADLTVGEGQGPSCAAVYFLPLHPKRRGGSTWTLAGVGQWQA